MALHTPAGKAVVEVVEVVEVAAGRSTTEHGTVVGTWLRVGTGTVIPVYSFENSF